MSRCLITATSRIPVMSLWIGLYLHRLSLDVWRLRWLTEPGRAAFVLDKGVVLAATPAAGRLGVATGPSAMD